MVEFLEELRKKSGLIPSNLVAGFSPCKSHGKALSRCLHEVIIGENKGKIIMQVQKSPKIPYC